MNVVGFVSKERCVDHGTWMCCVESFLQGVACLWVLVFWCFWGAVNEMARALFHLVFAPFLFLCR